MHDRVDGFGGQRHGGIRQFARGIHRNRCHPKPLLFGGLGKDLLVVYRIVFGRRKERADRAVLRKMPGQQFGHFVIRPQGVDTGDVGQMVRVVLAGTRDHRVGDEGEHDGNVLDLLHRRFEGRRGEGDQQFGTVAAGGVRQRRQNGHVALGRGFLQDEVATWHQASGSKALIHAVHGFLGRRGLDVEDALELPSMSEGRLTCGRRLRPGRGGGWCRVGGCRGHALTDHIGKTVAQPFGYRVIQCNRQFRDIPQGQGGWLGARQHANQGFGGGAAAFPVVRADDHQGIMVEKVRLVDDDRNPGVPSGLGDGVKGLIKGVVADRQNGLDLARHQRLRGLHHLGGRIDRHFDQLQPGLLRQSAQHAGDLDRIGLAGIVKRAQHLDVRQHLAGNPQHVLHRRHGADTGDVGRMIGKA